MNSLKALCAAVLFAATGSALATPFTMLSPTGINVHGLGATKAGGIVIDLFGKNGAHVVSQVATNTLYEGFATGDFVIGQRAGYSGAVLAALGGGLQSAAFRFTLLDGDAGTGDFDYNRNLLLANGAVFGNWSSVKTEQTDLDGKNVLSTGTGFRDGKLDTGWFYSTDVNLMSGLYSSLQSTNKLVFSLRDSNPNDNGRQFNQGPSASFMNVGQAPAQAAAAAVPEPGTLALMGLSLLALGAARRRSRKQ